MLLNMSLYNICLHVLAKPHVIQMYMNDLEIIPNNIKTSLFKILSQRGCIKNLKLFKNLMNQNITEINLSECEVYDEFLYCIFKCRYLQVLDLSLRRKQKRFISSEVLTSLFPNLPNLKILAIPHCKELTDDVIEEVCKTCTLLIELHIPNSSVTDYSLQLIGLCLKNLSIINLLGTQITDLGIQQMVEGELRFHLTEINIDKCPNVSHLSSCIIDENCPNIKIFTSGSFHEDEDSELTMNRIRSKAKQIFWCV